MKIELFTKNDVPISILIKIQTLLEEFNDGNSVIVNAYCDKNPNEIYEIILNKYINLNGV